MSLAERLSGRTFPPTPDYVVSAERIAEFARAIGEEDLLHRDPAAARAAGHPQVIAPVTFPIVVAFQAMQALLSDNEVGLALHRVVHGQQRFAQSRPIRAGDVLRAELTVDSVRTMAGADVLSTRTEVATVDGETVCVASATLVHRAEPSDQ